MIGGGGGWGGGGVGPLLRGAAIARWLFVIQPVSQNIVTENSQNQETQPREYCADNHSNVFQVGFLKKILSKCYIPWLL